MSTIDHDERLRRWRLLLGGNEADGTARSLTGTDIDIDRTLASLYDPDSGDGDDLSKSARRKRTRYRRWPALPE